MSLLYRKGCNSSRLGALYECEASQGKNVSLETTGSDPTERERLADCVEQIAAVQSRPAFAEIFEYFAPRVKSYLIRLGSDMSSAEEIMQEVMLNVWRKAGQYDRRQASVSTWIFRIARNRRIDTLRRTNKPELDAEDPMLRPAEAEQPDITVNRVQLEAKVREVIDCARDKGIPIRIGVNAGSLGKDLQRKYGEPTPEALVESAMRHVDILDRFNYPDFKVSVKASGVFMAVAAYRLLATKIDQPLHLGITEAGGLRSGTVKSAVGIGMLLMEGIGDTLRVSLAADPVEEVKVGFDILKSLQLRANGINFIACPSCSRQNFDVVSTMNILEQRLEDVRTPMDVAVIGCIVNGPGEAKEAHVGLPGATPNNLIYIDGEPSHKISNGDFIDHLEEVIRKRAADLERVRAEKDKNLITRSSS